MWDTDRPQVLLGLDRRGCEAALEYAVPDALRRGCGVHLVHVTRPAGWWSCVVDDVVMEEGELRRVGQMLLGDAAGRAQSLLDEQSPDPDATVVSSELSHGSVVGVLQSLSKRASVVVLQHHGVGPNGDSPSLSVTAGVAAVAHCPVVAVPDRWRPSAADDVVAAVKDPLRDRAVLEAARDEADRRGARLRVLQVVRVADAAPSLFAGADVPVEVVEHDGPVAEVLAEYAGACGLMVVGRHHRKHVIGAPLGRVARDLLRHCEAPVMVLDPVSAAQPVPPVQSMAGAS